jgi:hypothetical protein
LAVVYWRTWLAAGVGQMPSEEIVAAQAGMDRRTVRGVRRLVRRGRVAPDVPRARLAVALARTTQRLQPSPALTVCFALLVALSAWLSVSRGLRGHTDRFAVVWAGVTVWMAYILWALWRSRRAAPRAELENMRLLQEAGTPYPPDAVGAPVRASPLTAVTSAVVIFVFYDLGFGASSLASDGKALSFARVVGHGAFFATFMTLSNLTLMRSRHERLSQGPTAGEAAG